MSKWTDPYQRRNLLREDCPCQNYSNRIGIYH